MLVLKKLNFSIQMTGLNACMEQQEWLDNPDRKPTIKDFHRRKKELETALIPIMQRLSEPRKFTHDDSFQIIDNKTAGRNS